MLTKQEVISILREQFHFLHSEYGVKHLDLFGSLARDASEDASDVDLVIEFDRPLGFRFIELTEYLEQLLGRRVDVLTPAGLQAIRVGETARRIEESLIHVQ